MRNGNFTSKVIFGYIILFGLVMLVPFYFLNWEWGNRLQSIPECGCKRRFFYTSFGSQSKRLNSSCSDEGSFYEAHQKIVSLSMCIKDPNDTKKVQLYKEGAIENLKRMKKYYPDSTMRIYTDVDVDADPDYCKLLCSNPQLHWCDVRRTPSLGDQSDMFLMTWRFLPLGDPTVNYFLSLDLDSVLIERQVAAVNEWLQSAQPFHLMRDKHPEHNAPILGGLWGASNSKLVGDDAVALRKQIMEMARLPPKSKGRDQAILSRVIFFPRLKDILAFDSYFCSSSLGRLTKVRPFPVKRKDTHFDFAGNFNLGRGEYNISKCPLECRPVYGKDWEYC